MIIIEAYTLSLSHIRLAVNLAFSSLANPQDYAHQLIPVFTYTFD